MKILVILAALMVLWGMGAQAGEWTGVPANGVEEGSPAALPEHSDVPAPPREKFTDTACDFDGWVGKPVDEAAVKATGRIYRILREGDPMTMDFFEERINVIYDDTTKTVTRVFCG